MAGGVGSRFWPMSIPEKPKQFIDVMGIGKTMIQLTVERFAGIIEPDHVWIVTSKRMRYWSGRTTAWMLTNLDSTYLICVHGIAAVRVPHRKY